MFRKNPRASRKVDVHGSPAYLQLPLVFFGGPHIVGHFRQVSHRVRRRFSTELGRIDRWTLLPLAILAASFVAVLARSPFAPQERPAIRRRAGLAQSSSPSWRCSSDGRSCTGWWRCSASYYDGVLRKVYVGFLGVNALAVVLSVAIGWRTPHPTFPRGPSPSFHSDYASYCVVGGVPLGMFVIAAAPPRCCRRRAPRASAQSRSSLGVRQRGGVHLRSDSADDERAGDGRGRCFPGVDFLPGT